MIFVTVGTQLPFPRLLDAMAEVARDLDEMIVAQTNQPMMAETWQHMHPREQMGPAEFDAVFRKARVVVAHAGIGSVLSARKHCKPLIIFPRLHSLGEHRNDHQTVTAAQLADMPGIYVAKDENELRRLLKRDILLPAGEHRSPRRERLIKFIQSQIDSAI